jgi:hypothetical protein
MTAHQQQMQKQLLSGNAQIFRMASGDSSLVLKIACVLFFAEAHSRQAEFLFQRVGDSMISTVPMGACKLHIYGNPASGFSASDTLN